MICLKSCSFFVTLFEWSTSLFEETVSCIFEAEICSCFSKSNKLDARGLKFRLTFLLIKWTFPCVEFNVYYYFGLLLKLCCALNFSTIGLPPCLAKDFTLLCYCNWFLTYACTLLLAVRGGREVWFEGFVSNYWMNLLRFSTKLDIYNPPVIDISY